MPGSRKGRLSRLLGDRARAFVARLVSGGPLAAFGRAFGEGQVVGVDQRAGLVAQDSFDGAGAKAHDPSRVGDVIARQAAPELASVAVSHHHGVALAEPALDILDAGRQQALAQAQGGGRPGIDDERRPGA